MPAKLLRMDQSKFRNMDAKASCVGRKNNLIANNNQTKTKITKKSYINFYSESVGHSWYTIKSLS